MRKLVDSTTASDPELSPRIAAARTALAVAQHRLDLVQDRMRQIAAHQQVWDLRYRWLRGEFDHKELSATRA